VLLFNRFVRAIVDRRWDTTVPGNEARMSQRFERASAFIEQKLEHDKRGLLPECGIRIKLIDRSELMPIATCREHRLANVLVDRKREQINPQFSFVLIPNCDRTLYGHAFIIDIHPSTRRTRVAIVDSLHDARYPTRRFLWARRLRIAYLAILLTLIDARVCRREDAGDANTRYDDAYTAKDSPQEILTHVHIKLAAQVVGGDELRRFP